MQESIFRICNSFGSFPAFWEANSSKAFPINAAFVANDEQSSPEKADTGDGMNTISFLAAGGAC